MFARRLLVLATLAVALPGVAAEPDSKDEKKRKQFEERLKTCPDNWKTFELSFSTFGIATDPGFLKLVTDENKPRAKGARHVELITPKQAETIVDYLLKNPHLEYTYVPAAGFPFPGWYIELYGGPKGTLLYKWMIHARVDPTTVPMIQEMSKTFEGVAKKNLDQMLKTGVEHLKKANRK